MIVLIALISLASGIGIGYYFCNLECKEKIKHLVYDCRIDAALNPVEKTHIQEVRLIDKGYKKCFKCWRVSGMFYQYPDGLKGIQLKKITTKSGYQYICTDCLAAHNEEKEIMKDQGIEKARVK